MQPRPETPATPFINARSIRASIAVLVIIALALAYVGFQRETEREKGRAMFLASALSWKVSELVLETLRLEIALRRHALGQATRDEVQLRFDVVWSRVDIAENTTLSGNESFSSLMARYRAFLTSMEPVLFERALIAPRDALRGAADASDLAGELRVEWMNAFAGRQQSTFRDNIVAQPFTSWRETVITALLAVLLIYLLAEIFLGGWSHRRRMALLAEAKAAALANETKSRFLANVSHEIRTPLNGILGMASEMTSTPLNEDQRNCLEVIKHSGDVLLHTLNDVLDLSKVEAGQLSLESHDFDLVQVISTAAALYRPGAEAKGLTLTLDAHADGPSWVQGDPRRISQVLHNLLGNAVKFTDFGAITLSVGRDPSSGYVRFSVIDTGPGIDPRVQERIFEPFMQADGSVTREKGGTGLGLAISRSLCDAMGGFLSVESTLGAGATFTFALPLPDVAAPAPVTRAGDADDALDDPALVKVSRVLVVDDNATNRLLLRRFLRGSVQEVIEAEDGAEAIARWREEAVDLILMDVQMPVMDGLEATDQIRAIERETGRAATRIVAVTANVMHHQVAEYHARGVNDVLGKPVSKRAVLDILGMTGRAAA